MVEFHFGAVHGGPYDHIGLCNWPNCLGCAYKRTKCTSVSQ